MVYGDGDVVDHAQLSWPEGGGIMLGSVREDERASGERDQPGRVRRLRGHRRARRAVRAGQGGRRRDHREPHDTDYGSQDFAARDPEGNRWSFGTYRGEPRKADNRAG